MGLRAFSSQLLCEQVVGRGLRRTSYEVDPVSGLFAPEYVNIFGVPFAFLPHEGGEGSPPNPPSPTIAIKPMAEKMIGRFSWPNVIRIEHGFRPRLSLDWSNLHPLELDATTTAKFVELAPVIDGNPMSRKLRILIWKILRRDFRLQHIVFQVASDVYDQMNQNCSGGKANLLAQLIRLIEQFIRSDQIKIVPDMFASDDLRRRLIITLNMKKLVQHIWEAIKFEQASTIAPVFDRDRPILSTGDMRAWNTRKPLGSAVRSHINYCVY